MQIYEAIERLQSMRLIFILQLEITESKKRVTQITKDLEALNIAISTLEDLDERENAARAIRKRYRL